MKKALLCFLIPLFATAQPYSVDFEMSSPDVGPIWENWSSCGSASTDATLTQILQTHGASFCAAERMSYPSLTYANGGIAVCSGCDPNQFVADLLAYNTLVTKARISPAEMTYASQVNIAPDIYPAVTGSDPQNLIVTDNDALNAIYQTHHVFVQNNVGNFWIELNCDCSVNDLIADLLTGGFIGAADYWYQSVAILSDNNRPFTQTAIYPNPFKTQLNIQANRQITGYALYDLTGKKLLSVAAREAFDNQIQELLPGLYLLTLDYGNGLSSTHKIAKQ